MCKFASVETFSSVEMKIGICSDHAGLEYKTRLIAYLLRRGYEVVNFGTDSPESCDYSDFAYCDAGLVELLRPRAEAFIHAVEILVKKPR